MACALKPSSLFGSNNHKEERGGSEMLGGGWGGSRGVGTHSWPSLQWLSWLLPGFSASWLGSSLRMRAALFSENSSPSGSRPSGQGSFRNSSLSWAVCLCRENTHTHTRSDSTLGDRNTSHFSQIINVFKLAVTKVRCYSIFFLLSINHIKRSKAMYLSVSQFFWTPWSHWFHWL